MMVRFAIPAGAGISMFEKDAKQLIGMMGHSGTIPSAIRGEDIPEALQKLEGALKEEEAKNHPTTNEAEEDDEKVQVSTNVRAYPLIQLMKNAATQKKSIMWEYEHSII